MIERRLEPRARVRLPMWVNKHVGGFPYLAELVDLSADGLRIRTTLEPKADADSFSVELGLPGSHERIWLWAKRVRREGKFEALQLLGTDLLDRSYLSRLARWHSEQPATA